jgi:adenosine deaminase
MPDRRDLTALPKAHLHLHLDGAMRRSTLRELAGAAGVAAALPRGYGSFASFSRLGSDADVLDVVLAAGREAQHRCGVGFGLVVAANRNRPAAPGPHCGTAGHPGT